MVSVNNFLLVEMTDVNFHTFSSVWLVSFRKACLTMLDSDLRGKHRELRRSLLFSSTPLLIP
jgi:hypothetical protein